MALALALHPPFDCVCVCVCVHTYATSGVRAVVPRRGPAGSQGCEASVLLKNIGAFNFQNRIMFNKLLLHPPLVHTSHTHTLALRAHAMHWHCMCCAHGCVAV